MSPDPRAGVGPDQRPRPLVDVEVNRHTQRLLDDPTLMTVTHTPNGIVTHVVAAETNSMPAVRMEGDRVVTRLETKAYGMVLSVLGGPAVVEIALHQTTEQRDDYARAVQAIDREAAEHVHIAGQASALAILQYLGVTVEQPDEKPPATGHESVSLDRSTHELTATCQCGLIEVFGAGDDYAARAWWDRHRSEEAP